MCRGNDHGGRRCPGDTSAARRHRRKAAKVKATLANVPKKVNENAKPVTSEISPGVEELKKAAEALQKEIYATPPANITQEEYDAQMEVKLTAFGGQVADEVEKITGITTEKIRERKDAIENSIYDEKYGIAISDANEEYTDNLQLIQELPEEDLNIIKEAYPRYRYHSPHSHMLASELEQLSPEAVALLQKTEASLRTLDAARADFDQLDKKYDEEIEKLYLTSSQKLQEAYRTVISQLRPTGGALNVKENSSDKAAVELLAKTAGKDYPTAWLEEHNAQSSDFVAKITENRPNYAASGQYSELDEDDGIDKAVPTTAYAVGTENLVAKIEEVFGKDTPISKFALNHPFTGETLTGFSTQYSNETIYDPNIHKEEPSVETGWQFKPTLSAVGLGTPGMSDDEIMETWSKSYWVKPETTTKKEVKVLSMFAANDDEPKSTMKVTAEAISYHEFAHRLEEIKPIIARQEKAFLKRRTGKTEENMFQDLQFIAPGEFAHSGGFVDTYMGREYLQGGNHYEVLSTGVESLYGGSYGGLMGLSKNFSRPDTDHRNFVLGTLGLL